MFCCVILSHTCFKPLYATFLKYILEPSVHCSTAWYWIEIWLIFWGYFEKNVLGRVFWGDFGGRSRFKVVSIVQRGWESIVNASLTLSSVTIIPWTSALMWCNCSRLILAAGVYMLTQSPASVCVPDISQQRVLSGESWISPSLWSGATLGWMEWVAARSSVLTQGQCLMSR